MLVRAIERAGYAPGDRRRDLARHRGVRIRPRRPLHARRSSARDARPRRHDRRCCWAGSTAIRSRRSRIRSPRTTATAGSRSRAPRGTRVQIIGDDYLTTNAARVAEAAADRACNAVLIKPNQAGTLTETQRRARRRQARRASARSSPRAPARPRTSRSRTSRSAGTRASSRSARSRAASGWRSGTSALRIEEALGANARYAGARRSENRQRHLLTSLGETMNPPSSALLHSRHARSRAARCRPRPRRLARPSDQMGGALRPGRRERPDRARRGGSGVEAPRPARSSSRTSPAQAPSSAPTTSRRRSPTATRG